MWFFFLSLANSIVFIVGQSHFNRNACIPTHSHNYLTLNVALLLVPNGLL